MIDYKGYKSRKDFNLKELLQDVCSLCMFVTLLVFFATSAFSLLSTSIGNCSYIEPVNFDVSKGVNNG